ncbi:hypothetical protein BMF94_3599 [Rhodotorula taiwanensis]|uniref:Uncharacterized protein n=1 Tax=Rhodotorula taiwanensis TaxID=741276 RepID=A0A2S5B923_9BASI|nr:hypothetical protein BMF94_3599 [Rhodotorula taiwanensis]
MLNGTRARDSDSDDDISFREANDSKRVNVDSPGLQSGHYDIYAVPSFIPPSPILQSHATHYQSCSLVIVNRTAGLTTGLGIRIGLAAPPDQPRVLHATSDPGFFLPREAGYDPHKAVLLGWVEEERLADLDRIVRSCQVPVVADPPRGGEVLEWLLTVGRQLEFEGILANADLLLADVLQQRTWCAPGPHSTGPVDCELTGSEPYRRSSLT